MAKLSKGVNDLKTLYPEIAAEWDYEKNYPLRPEDFTKGSQEKVWWLCKEGHSYQARIYHRTRNCGTGCPYCAGNLPIKGETDLKTVYPEIAVEWDYKRNYPLRPEDFTKCSGKKVWWCCKEEHSYPAQIRSRTTGKTGCPYCAGNLPIKGETDLKTMCPEIAAEWDYEKNYPLRPEDFTKRAKKKVWWRCKEGHSYQACIYNRTGKQKSGCPYCSGKLPIKGETDLKTVYPEVAAEWDYEKNYPFRPENFTKCSDEKVWWRCKEGHSYPAQIRSKTTGKKTGCPYCAGKLPIQGENDLMTLHPDICLDWDYERNKKGPFEFTSSSNRFAYWKCHKCGYKYRRRIYIQVKSVECKKCK